MSRMRAFLSLLIFAFISCGNDLSFQNEGDDFKNILLRHIEKYPDMQIEDALKIAYQSAMGPSHLLEHGNENAKKYLVREFAAIKPDSSTELTENISNGIIRVNLIKFKSLALNIDSLFEAVKKTAAIMNPDTALFLKHINIIENMIVSEELKYSTEAFRKLIQVTKEKKFSPFHHSSVFIEKYDPHYRIVSKSIFYQYFPNQD